MSRQEKSLIINSQMLVQVLKNDGSLESVSFDKILRRIDILCKKMNLNRIDVIEVAQDTIGGLFNGISTEEIDHFTAVNCAEKIRDDPQYDTLAAGLCISRLHKMTNDDFMKVTDQLYFNKDDQDKLNPLVTKAYYDYVCANIDKIQPHLDYDKDYDFDYFGFKTLERAYLQRSRTKIVAPQIDNKDIVKIRNEKSKRAHLKEKEIKMRYGTTIERPQHLWMRVALSLNMDNIDEAIETYRGLSERTFIFGSPTLYNSGSKWNQMSSCFLLKMGDSIEQIYDTIKDVALISKRAGGIGISMSDIRASGSIIRGTNGTSSGPIPFIQELNWTGRAVNQGGRRNGAIAIYIEPWHSDIFHFCELRSNKGQEDSRARDIFLALWINDLFMKRVRDNKMWSLMCPDECPGLTQSFGDEFEALYEKYERDGKYKRQVPATELWFHIITCQIETGMPYMCFKDNANRQSNHQNLGVIQSSNLCSEIMEYTNVDEIAVCNLASICLPKFITLDIDNKPVFDYNKLVYVAGLLTANLNKVIDNNYYPVEKAKLSNLKHRPIGLGVQGLADVFCIFDVSYDSDEARILNRKIFESIYYGSVKKSIELAKRDGPYSTFKINGGSPFSHGKLQFHLWNLDKDKLLMGFDWDTVINDIQVYGIRNSLLTTVMPTASTSQIMGNSECTEPIATNVYTRSTLAGEFTICNKYLVNKLISLGLWNSTIRDELLFDKGSVQQMMDIPDSVKAVYKTAYELKNKPIIQQSIERGPFIDQSQSLNLFCKTPDFDMLTSCHFYTWGNKLKTGLYYLRTQPAVDPIQFGLDAEIINDIKKRRKHVDEPIGTNNNNNNGPLVINSPCGDSCSA